MFSSCTPTSQGYTEVDTHSTELLTPLPTPVALTKEESEVARRKCKKCTNYYTIRDNPGPCHYHPGTWREPNSRSGALVGWSCCAVVGFADPYRLISVLNNNALKFDGQGCQNAPAHEEDEDYARSIGIFPFSLEAAKSATSPAAQASAAGAASAPKVAPDRVVDNCVEHVLLPTDTLQGLAIRFNTSVAEIKRVNNLISFSIGHLSKIMIPLQKGQSPPPRQIDPKMDALINFKKSSGASSEEAKYYLGNHDYDLTKALKEYKEDKDWERKQNSTSSAPQ